MQAEKLSISLPSSLVQFIENYKLTKGCKSRSQVIELAIELLRYRRRCRRKINATFLDCLYFD
ncbi:hypothetical protein [Aphanizomenon sp. CS-733/32]|uniref:hypothetical protein n=1 Tax=Aphanizomenon sp. CS-733/32 TaxID=3021715 RepID=UPI00232B10CB|nr:hypothetical protein [Aphanizomenon sp. CS-733/32]